MSIEQQNQEDHERKLQENDAREATQEFLDQQREQRIYVATMGHQDNSL